MLTNEKSTSSLRRIGENLGWSMTSETYFPFQTFGTILTLWFQNPQVSAMTDVSTEAEKKAFKFTLLSEVTGDLFYPTWGAYWPSSVWDLVMDPFGNSGEISISMQYTIVLDSNAYIPTTSTAKDMDGLPETIEDIVSSIYTSRSRENFMHQIRGEKFRASSETHLMSESEASKIDFYVAAFSYQKLVHEFFEALVRMNCLLGDSEGFLSVVQKIRDKVKST